MAHKLALKHWVVNARAFELFKDGVKQHMVCDPFSRDPRAVTPVKSPPLLVKRIAARVRTIGGGRMGRGHGNIVVDSERSRAVVIGLSKLSLST